MDLAMIGLGRMGGNMARRLLRGGFGVVGYDRSPEAVRALAAEGLAAAPSLEALRDLLPAPRTVWVMLPAGSATEAVLEELAGVLEPGDLVIDGGNAYYKDSQRRAAWLGERGLLFADVGVSGGVWGLENGYGLMFGGPPGVAARLEPVLRALAPSPGLGWVHAGPVGAGHFAKMVHNGIEYGMMQALAEGLNLLRKKREFGFDLARLTEAWRHGTVIRSWLLDLTAQYLAGDQDLSDIAPVVADSGEGRWTVLEAVELGVPIPVITQSLYTRFESQDEEDYDERLLAVMRKMFGGHGVKKARD
ncbi:6-phosphogluconate dehydrogenase, NAD(+)-dependent, decarboxylating [Calidithermus terrae]|uniref:6-phosphogluconate dehydrogenase, NAD(+)-dependent, decarboxylating n=1 Tax=Calidithermus terrae TaxID=1408545 RepID=A0A399ESQ7_9DEIN|nr:decarboxylating 6-phosphogluconate dehydrogenase [Calidithermus terrae]RIH86079.1 6-phosphogluconate dehydrogenase, NAD(+)-dependent, decarboxylating [Calidithermus terrae]